jgi:hypothetical protein
LIILDLHFHLHNAKSADRPVLENSTDSKVLEGQAASMLLYNCCRHSSRGLFSNIPPWPVASGIYENILLEGDDPPSAGLKRHQSIWLTIFI